MHKSRYAHQYILNTANPADWDILAIQEPWLDAFNNARGFHHWRILYPPTHLHDDSQCTRSIILINSNISTDAYSQIPVPCPDITAVRFHGEHGTLSLLNVYNDCSHNDSFTELSRHLLANQPPSTPSPVDPMIWLGDFNRHHPLWESADN